MAKDDQGDLNAEWEAVDLVTNCMITLDFLEQITIAIPHPDGPKISITQFYNDWLTQRRLPQHKPPFNLGVIAGYLYVGLLLTKENWSELLPDKRISQLGSEWGLSETVCKSKEPNPTIAQFVRRVRNSLGHANFAFFVPEDFTKPSQFHQKVTVTFKDANQRDPADTFEVTLRLEQVELLIRTFQGIVHTTARTKKAKTMDGNAA